MRTQAERPVILHFACDPRTGVWSLIKGLARKQAEVGYNVSLGLLLPTDWPYFSELPTLGIPCYVGKSPRIFGTAQFLYHRYFNNPLESWVIQLQSKFSAARIAIHFHNAWLAGCLIVTRPLGAAVRQIVTFHGIPAQESLRAQPVRRYLHRAMAQRLLRHGCTLVAVDDRTPVVANELFGIEPGRFVVIPNGVEKVWPVRTIDDRCEAPVRVGFVGVIQEGKGWRLVAEAVERLARANLPVRLLIAGAGPEAAAAHAWCAARPRWASFLSYVSAADKVLMPQLDVLCLMSRVEGLPMVVLEAMAAGVVVVSTAVGGIPAVIVSGRNGFLVERTTDALADVLIRLVRDRRLLGMLSRNATVTIKERYTLDSVAKQYDAIYW